ncbi:NAC domain-containing protein 82-like isoform X2 [Olea europaea var. sylvestris]|uniref:NAC domain-containing protein 82-like isoform X2 n=1 Tax=Olea europaea var. sylvestris TaxID=158386 RepID=UPI000C1CE037|nr:NAC domain-containing protein 82-like isoform X2 [Olea europaea var. sylvestris]
MARTSLPPGFRFHPTDVELVMYYLKRKIMGKRLHFEAIAEVNIYKFSPWDLKDKSILKSRDLEWFFFCPREKKYACGVRMKRATENGYWKTTGKDRPVRYNENVVGMVRTLVFHLGHAPQGRRTNWVIHEYRILDEQLSAAGLQDLYVLCKVFEKNGPGPKNGAQYGAPFNEADWDDDDDVQTHVESSPSGGPSSTALTLPENQCCSVITSMVNPGNTPGPSLIEAGPSHFSGPAVSGVPLDLDLDDEVLRWLATFRDDSVLLDDNGNHENRDDHNQKGKNKCLPCLDGNDIYNGLCDLDSWGSMNEGGLNFAGMQKDGYLQNYTLPQNDTAYLELNDLEVPLNHPAEVNETEQMQFDNFGPCSQGNTEQLIFGGNFSDMDLYASCQGHFPVPPEGSKQPGSCSDVLQAESSNREGRNNAAAYSLDFTGGHSEDGGIFHVKHGQS